jgi:hypothetical protein
MSDKELGKKAFEELDKAKEEQKLAELKAFIQATLETLEEKKKIKSEVEEDLRILNLNLEDARKGDTDKIIERITKSQKAQGLTTVVPVVQVSRYINWQDLTGGTYQTFTGKIYYF